MPFTLRDSHAARPARADNCRELGLVKMYTLKQLGCHQDIGHASQTKPVIMIAHPEKGLTDCMNYGK